MIVLHLTHSSIVSDSRIHRSLEASRKFFSQTNLASVEDTDEGGLLAEGVVHHSISFKQTSVLPALLKRLRNALKFVWSFREVCIEVRPHVIHCHSFPSLLPAFLYRLTSPAILIYDAHELESGRSGLSNLAAKFVTKLELVSWRYVDGLISVSDKIVDWYIRRFGEKQSEVIRNIPDPRTYCKHDHTDLRTLYSIPSNYTVSVYVGILEPNRGIELVLNAFQSVQLAGGKHALVFLGQGSLEKEILRAQQVNKLILLHGLVAPGCIVPIIKSADVGLMLTRNDALSEDFALPNKLFQYVDAGLHVVGTDLEVVRATIGNLAWASLIDYAPQQLATWLGANEIIAKRRRSQPGELGSWIEEEEKLVSFYSWLSNKATTLDRENS